MIPEHAAACVGLLTKVMLLAYAAYLRLMDQECIKQPIAACAKSLLMCWQDMTSAKVLHGMSAMYAQLCALLQPVLIAPVAPSYAAGESHWSADVSADSSCKWHGDLW